VGLAASYASAGYSPSQIKAAYNLPSTGGAGTTIAIIDVYDTPTIQSDLAVFCNQFGLPPADLEVHEMPQTSGTNSTWTLETALDVEWAHAIAPQAKILLVEAQSPSDDGLLPAVDYARSRSDVVAISMSWGGDEFAQELSYDYHFTSTHGAVFFASSGDTGAGVSWPACSPNVVAVGGTTLTLNPDGTVASETAWSGSGGGINAYEPKPAYQAAYGITGSKREVPDVAFNAAQNPGFAVYQSGSWYRVYGTSAGAPQWAAIQALGLSCSNTNFYQRASSPAYASYFRDITSGSNGAFNAAANYDLVTGLGSPLTTNFAPQPATQTSITLVAAGQSTLLNATNQFRVDYLLNNVSQTAYISDGTSNLNADPGSNVTIAGTSTSSTAQEKWVFSSDGGNVTSAGLNTTLYYFDLVSQSPAYAVAGGGNPQPPSITYVTAPSAASSQPATASLQLSQTAQLIWPLKATIVSVSNPLSAGSNEQWSTQTASWVVNSPNQLPQQITYTHKFLLTVTGVPAASNWYNNGDVAQVTLPGVSSRTSGNGQRLSSYQVDGGAAVQIQPTLGTFAISVPMGAPHQVAVNSVQQYQVTLDGSASRMLASITSPTISGDGYWYDAGTSVSVMFSGVSSRSGGEGQRISSCTTNGATTNVATTGTVSAVNGPIFSAQSISVTLTSQYQLTLLSGSQKSITAPSIPGDSGWYDTGAPVTLTCNYTLNETANGSRINAITYTIGQSSPIAITRAANGTFPIQVNMTQPETVIVSSVTQYPISVSGGNNIAFSPSSPTNDDFFDAGANVSVTTENIWNQTDENSRLNLASYALDGSTVNVSRAESGNTTILVTFNQAHSLTFNLAVQYLVSFQFTDYSGTHAVTPVDFAVDTGTVVNVSESSLWLDKGTQFRISSVVWQNVDVKPNQNSSYVVNSPLSQTVPCRIYDMKLTAKDYLNIPISGASVTVTFANQTTTHLTTASDGSVEIPMVPLGTYQATISYFGTSVSLSGDASAQPQLTGKIFTSLPSIGVIVTAAVSCVAVAFLLFRKLRASQR